MAPKRRTRRAVERDHDIPSARTYLDVSSTETALLNSADSVEAALAVATEQARLAIGATLAIGSLGAMNGHDAFSTVSGLGGTAAVETARLERLAMKIDRPIRRTGAQLARSVLGRQARTLAGKRLSSRGWLAAPLVGRDGATIGLLQLFGHRRGAFADADEAGLAHFALITSLAVENFRAGAESEQRRREAEDLARAARTLTESLDIDVVAQRTVETVLSLFHATGATLRRLEPDGSLTLIASRGDFPNGRVLPRGVGVSGRAALEGRTVRVKDVSFDSSIVPTADLRGLDAAARIRGTLAVPLRVQGRTIGTLAVGDEQPRLFTDGEVELLEAFAAQVALALENARFYTEVKDARDFLQSIATNSADAIVTTDGQGRLTFFSPGSEQMLGYRAAEVLGRPTADFVMTGLEETRPFMRRLVADGQINDYETALRAKDGRWVETSNTFSLLRDANGAVVGTVGVIRDITERKRAERTAEHRRQMTETLAGLGRLVTRSLDPSVVATRIVESARTLLGAAVCGVYRRDAMTGDFYPLAYDAATGHTFGPDFVVSNGLGIIGLAVQQRTSVATTDALGDLRLRLSVEFRHRLEATPYRSALAVPLVAYDDVIGAITIVDQTGRAWTGEDTRLATTFGDFAVVALENASLYEKAERRRRASETLADLGHLVTRSLKIDEVATRIVESARSLLTAAMCGVYAEDPGTGDLRPLAHMAPPDHTFDGSTVIGKGMGIVGLSVRERAGVASPDWLTDDRPRFTPDLRSRLERTPYRAAVAVPLMLQDRVTGAVAIGDRTGREFTTEEIGLVGAFADFAAVAIENARLYEEADRRRREAETFADLVASISSSLQLDTILQRIVSATRELCDADRARVALRDSAADTMVFRYWAGENAPARGTPSIEAGRGQGGLVMVTGEPSRTDDYANDPTISEHYHEWARAHGIVTQLVVPIRVGDRIEGLVYVANTSRRPFTDRDEAVLARLADYAAIALENARLFDDEQTARSVAEESERRLTDLIQSLDAIVWEADAATGRLSFVSDRAETMLGYPVSRWLTEPDFWIEHVHPEDRAEASARRLSAVVTGLNYSSTYRMIAADGDVLWVRDRVQVVKGPEGHVEQLRGVKVNATEGMVARSALEGRTRQQVAVAELAQRGLAGGDLPTLMATATSLVASGLSVEYTRVLEIMPDGTSLLLNAGVGWREDEIGRALVGIPEDSQLGYTLLSRAPVVVRDFETEARFTRGPLLLQHNVASGITVIIDGVGGPFGILGAHATRPRRFSDDDVNFMQAVANVLALAIERKQVERALEQTNERLRSLREIDQGIVLARSPSAIAQVALIHIRRLVPCQSASVALFHADSGEALLLASDPAADPMVHRTTHRPLAEYGTLDALRAGDAQVVDDVTAMPERSAVFDVLARDGVRSFVDVPLVSRDDLIGVLTLTSERPAAFLPNHLEIAREVARPMAVAIEQARLNERVWIGRERLQLLSRRLVEVQESERRHLSRELHDEIGQILTGLKFTLDATRGGPDPALNHDLGRAREMVADLMERVRTLSLDLRPGMLDDLGLLPTLLWHFERYGTEVKLDIDFKHRGIEGRRFPAQIETAAYRIVQEALTNVARHAGRRSTTVRAWADATTLGVQVEDGGAGFEPRAAISASRGGLSGMRERALLLGGRFDIESSPGRGTRITAELPLHEPLERRRGGR